MIRYISKSLPPLPPILSIGYPSGSATSERNEGHTCLQEEAGFSKKKNSKKENVTIEI